MRSSNAVRVPDTNLILLSELHAQLHRVVQGFAPMREFPELVCPPEPLDLSEVFPDYQEPEPPEEADDEDDDDLEDEEFDEEDEPGPCGFPSGLSEETMLSADWLNTPLGCVYRIYAITLPGGFRVYIEMDELDGNRILAASSLMPTVADSKFVAALLSSNGEAFGTAVFGGPPDYLDIGVDFAQERWIELFDDSFSACGIWDYLESDSQPDDMYEVLARLVDEEREKRRALARQQRASRGADGDPVTDEDLDDEIDEEIEWLSDENRRKLLDWFIDEHRIAR
jgi:hypothetical protein